MAKPEPLGMNSRLSGSGRSAGAEDDSHSREAKRQRTAATCTCASDALVPPPSLTPDLWALVMSCLPFSEIVRCTAISRVFRRDVVPLVKDVTVMFSRDMKQLKSARRFQGAEKVRIALHKKHRGKNSGQWIDEISLAAGEEHELIQPEAGTDQRRFITSQDFFVFYQTTTS